MEQGPKIAAAYRRFLRYEPFCSRCDRQGWTIGSATSVGTVEDLYKEHAAAWLPVCEVMFP
mgnify:CR=1 FL=1